MTSDDWWMLMSAITADRWAKHWRDRTGRADEMAMFFSLFLATSAALCWSWYLLVAARPCATRPIAASGRELRIPIFAPMDFIFDYLLVVGTGYYVVAGWGKCLGMLAKEQRTSRGAKRVMSVREHFNFRPPVFIMTYVFIHL